jgi:hypothetical protein
MIHLLTAWVAWARRRRRAAACAADAAAGARGTRRLASWLAGSPLEGSRGHVAHGQPLQVNDLDCAKHHRQECSRGAGESAVQSVQSVSCTRPRGCKLPADCGNVVVLGPNRLPLPPALQPLPPPHLSCPHQPLHPSLPTPLIAAAPAGPCHRTMQRPHKHPPTSHSPRCRRRTCLAPGQGSGVEHPEGILHREKLVVQQLLLGHTYTAHTAGRQAGRQAAGTACRQSRLRE